AVRAAVGAGAAFTFDPDPLSVLDAGRYPHVDGVGGRPATLAAACFTRCFNDHAAAAAIAARLGHGEHSARRAGLHTASLAFCADLRGGTGLGARPVTRRTCLVAGQPQRDRRPVYGLLEAD